MKGFTLFELLIAMLLTAVIGAVMFKTWDMVIQSGEKARWAVESRERERIVFGILDNDIAGLLRPAGEESALPRLAKEQQLPDDGFYEMMGRKKETAMPNGESMLLSFATYSSLGPDGPLPGIPVCVEYRLARQAAGKLRMKRRERAFCGVSGDFPWSEITLMDNLESAAMKVVFAGGAEMDAWQPGDLENNPTAVKFSFRKAGDAKDTEMFFSLFAGSEEVGWEEKSF